MTGKWASRVMDYGSNYLGRWVWVTLRGRCNQKLTVVSMYRPNPGSKSSGPTTVWSQQGSRLQELMTEDNCNTNIDPREQCLQDFEKWVRTVAMEGCRLIVLADTNKSLNDKTEDYIFSDTIKHCSLSSAMEAKHAGKVYVWWTVVQKS